MKEAAGSWQTEGERKKVSPYLLQALANRVISEQGSLACLRPFPLLVKAVVLIRAPLSLPEGLRRAKRNPADDRSFETESSEEGIREDRGWLWRCSSPNATLQLNIKELFLRADGIVKEFHSFKNFTSSVYSLKKKKIKRVRKLPIMQSGHIQINIWYTYAFHTQKN